MQNFDRKAREDLNDEARRVGPTGADRFEEPGFLDVHNAFDKFTTNEARSDSEEILMEADVNDALEAYAQVRPDIRAMMEPDMITPGYMAPSFQKRKELLKVLEGDIVRDSAKFPDAGLTTLSGLMETVREKTTDDRENAMRMFANARGVSKAGMVTGPAVGVITDPLILATLPLGAGTISGAGVAGNAWKAFKLEALIAGVSETAIQPSVYNWKKQINSPYSVQEAAFNVVTAMVAAGAIRATGSAIIDAVELRSIAQIKRAEGGKLAESEADILESHADNVEAAGDDIPGHFDRVDRAINDFEAGRSPVITADDFGESLPKILREQAGIDIDQVDEFIPQSIIKQAGVTDEIAFSDFVSTQKGKSLDDIYQVAEQNQIDIARLGADIRKDLGEDSVEFLDPGIKGRERSDQKFAAKGYDDASEMTDIIRGGFVVATPDDAQKAINAIGKKYEILDEQWNVTAAGYADRKVLVKFKDGSVGEVQMWEPHYLIAKEGKEAIDKLPEKWIDKKQKIPSKGKTGHDLYVKQRELVKDNVVLPENAAEFKRLEKQMNKLYNDAKRLANRDWKTLIETRRPDSKISAGEAVDQTPGSAADLTKKPRIEPSEGSAITAGRPSQSIQDLTSEDLKGVSIPDNIAKGDKEIKAKFTDEVIDPDTVAREAAIDREIYEQDLDIPVGEKTLDGKIVAETKGAREIYDEINEQAIALKEIEGCLLG